jgi:hypothetical protein
MWSEEHWKLIERSLALLGEIGNDEIFITAINKTHLGNENSMVRYVKQADPGPGGQPVYKPDFSIAERYLDLALKYFGKPPVICLYVWEYTSGHGWHMPDRPADDKFFLDQKETAKITVVDPKSGALSEAELPFWGTEESRAFWKPVVEGMREIVKKRGVEHSLMFGLAGDARPRKITEEDFQTIAPDVKWALQSHPYQEKLWTQPLGLGAFVWGARKLLDKHATELQCGWKPKPSGMIFCHFPRGGFVSASEPEYQRFSFERALASGMNGISRQGGDFWIVDIGSRRPVCLAGRYGVLPGAVSLNTAGNPYWLNPGKHGAIATTGFEMIRENLEECEARVLIESVLTDPAKYANLDENLKQRCVELLADRVKMILAVNSIFYFTANENKKSVPEFVPVNWQGEMERLFTLAGEVDKKINGGK